MASAPAMQPTATPTLSTLYDFYVPAYRLVLNGKVQPQLVQDGTFAAFARHTEPFLTPQPLDPLAIDRPAFIEQMLMRLAVSPPRPRP